jgi:hypothetical protein
VFFRVFLGGFFGWVFLGGFFIANPGHLAEDVDNCGGCIVDFAEEDDQIFEKDPSGGEDGRKKTEKWIFVQNVFFIFTCSYNFIKL